MNLECKPTNGLGSDCVAVADLKKQIIILEKALELACNKIGQRAGYIEPSTFIKQAKEVK